MNTCCSCGEVYVPQRSAWGDACGECIAAKIELMLMGGLPARSRMPIKRAVQPEDRSSDADREFIQWSSDAPRRALGD